MQVQYTSMYYAVLYYIETESVLYAFDSEIFQ